MRHIEIYRASQVVVDLGWVDWILSFPMSAKLFLG